MRPLIGFTLATAALTVFTALPPRATAEQVGRSPRDEVTYRVVAVHPQSWVVTAEDTETGKSVHFKLNPRAFQGKRFHADLGDRRAGGRFSAVAPRNEPLSNCCEMAGTEGGSPGRSPRSAPPTRPMPPSHTPPPPPGQSTGSGDLEILSVDPGSWVVTARDSGSGETVRFEVDPQAFVGFEFRADLRSLRRGQGFSLMALNNAPLDRCCTLLPEGR